MAVIDSVIFDMGGTARLAFDGADYRLRSLLELLPLVESRRDRRAR